ncbi:MAG: hypothetical protein HY554_19055, partial [Elusimicrobia bacterium]|nr:hypothetical protein [Elusimicrobiota bacterium]
AATNVGDALLRWVLVTATGTSAQAGGVGSDVDQVGLWRDVNNDGLLQMASDVLVGSGTFGNSGQPLAARVLMGTPERIVTQAMAGRAQRYFVTYRISPNAVTSDPFTQEPRTLGATLTNAALPTNNPNLDEALANALSLPNFYDPASPLPFEGKVRKIIPAAQSMYVKGTPLFTTPRGVFPAPLLVSTAPVSTPGTVEAAWIVTSTAGLAAGGPTAYMIVDGEIISYDTLGFNALLGVHRGLLNTQALAHSAGAALGPAVEQGTINNAILKLEAWSGGFQIQWERLRLVAQLPPGINVADADVAGVKLWKSVEPSTGPAFHRDPATGVNATDVLLGSGKLTQGVITLDVADPTLNNVNYALVPGATQTYYVSIDIDQGSRFSHALLSPPNEGIGLGAANASDFVLGPSGAGHGTQIVQAARSAMQPIAPTVNTMNLDIAQFAQAFARQADTNVALAKITAKTDRNTVKWERLRLDRTGSPDSLDTDVTLVRLYRDSNGNGAFDAADYAKVNGNEPNLISFGNETYSTGTVTLVFRNPVVVSTTPVDFFVAYDFDQFAKVQTTHGLRIGGTGYATVQVPNAVSLSSPSFQTSPEIIMQDVPTFVELGVNDLITNGADNQVGQAQENVSMLRFNLGADVGLAIWESLRLERSGNSVGEDGPPNGRNTNVGFVRIWRDINQNDRLDALDVNINEAATFGQVPVSAVATPPFTMVVASTAGFPANGIGRLWVSEAELMTFSGGYGTQLIGGATYPTLTIISRGDKLGQGPTPWLTHPVGAVAKKVDLFDQLNDSNLQTVLYLAVKQTVQPAPAAYLLTYNIGATAVKNEAVGVNILDRSWIGVSVPNDTSPGIRLNVTNLAPYGPGATKLAGPRGAYPFFGGKVFITPLLLRAQGRSVAPAAVTGGQGNVPIQQLTLNISADFVNVAQLRLTQLGTVASPPLPGAGRGDVKRITVWIDDGNGAFTPNTDKQIASLIHNGFPGGSPSFDNGLALVDLSVDGVPYLRVSTKAVDLFIAVDVSSADVQGRPSVGHLLGFSLERFADMIGPNSAPLTAASHPSNATVADILEFRSSLLLVSPAVIPLSSVLPILTWAPNGYPAYALLDSSGNVILDARGKPIPDTGRWMVQASTEPLIDINGDGRADNFAYPPDPVPLPPGAQPSPKRYVSLDGTGLPSMDLDGDGLIDVDINRDGVPDRIVDDGTGQALYFVRDVVGNQYPVSDQALAVSAWSNNTSKLQASWQVPTSSVTGFQLAAGKDYLNPTFYSNGWVTMGSTTTGILDGLGLPVPKTTVLDGAIGTADTTITVKNALILPETGKLWIGSEIVGAIRVNGTTFRTTQLAGCPTANGRGCDGSLPQPHLAAEPVSDQGILISVRGYTGATPQTATAFVPSAAGRPIHVLRIDATEPGAPASVSAQVPPGYPAGTQYVLGWAKATDSESDIMAYEIQERRGTDPVWRSLAVVPAYTAGYSPKITYQVGNSSVYVWEAPRDGGQFYSYRVRSINYAGTVSAWSPESASVATTLVTSPLSNVSNYPNPFDSRKGGPEGKTTITYTLGSNSDVTITIYDLLGYVVKVMSFSPGSTGGRAGPNFVEWDGKNAQGRPVAKGGYICRIKAGSSAGTATVIRKIGVIH